MIDCKCLLVLLDQVALSRGKGSRSRWQRQCTDRSSSASSRSRCSHLKKCGSTAVCETCVVLSVMCTNLILTWVSFGPNLLLLFPLSFPTEHACNQYIKTIPLSWLHKYKYTNQDILHKMKTHTNWHVGTCQKEILFMTLRLYAKWAIKHKQHRLQACYMFIKSSSQDIKRPLTLVSQDTGRAYVWLVSETDNHLANCILCFSPINTWIVLKCVLSSKIKVPYSHYRLPIEVHLVSFWPNCHLNLDNVLLYSLSHLREADCTEVKLFTEDHDHFHLSSLCVCSADCWRRKC